MSARGALNGGVMVGRVIGFGLACALLTGCDCGSKPAPLDSGTPEGFDEIMRDHDALSVAARNALIRGDVDVARQAMKQLAFFMEHVPAPEGGREYARLTRELAQQVRDADDVEEACMGFARLSYACGQCHHALDRGPPMTLDPVPEGQDLRMHMRRHYWAVERMWDALLADSTSAFQKAAEVLAEAPLHGSRDPDQESHQGVTRLAYEVHDLAFAAAVEGKAGEDEYVPRPGEQVEVAPTGWGQAEVFGALLSTCNQCHTMLDVDPSLTLEERRQVEP